MVQIFLHILIFFSFFFQIRKGSVKAWRTVTGKNSGVCKLEHSIKEEDLKPKGWFFKYSDIEAEDYSFADLDSFEQSMIVRPEMDEKKDDISISKESAYESQKSDSESS